MDSYFFPWDLCCHLGISKIFDWKPIIHHMPFFFTPSALISLFLLGVGNCLGITCLLCIARNSSFLGTLTKRTFFLKIGFLKVPCLCEFWNISSVKVFFWNFLSIIRFQWCCCVYFNCKSIFVSLGSSCSVICFSKLEKLDSAVISQPCPILSSLFFGWLSFSVFSVFLCYPKAWGL